MDIFEESVVIDAPAGQISSVLAYPIDDAPRGAALIAGPHPLMGGGLQNNVVRSVARGMAEYGYVSLRFGYAGAIPSAETMQEFWRTGIAPDDANRIQDARSALQLLESACSGPLVLIGYSFGASVVGRLLSESSAGHVVFIGPTLCQHSFDRIQNSSVSKLIITGDNDFATPLHVTREWFEKIQPPKKLAIVEAAEHFYRGLEDRLVTEITQWI